MRFLRSLLLSEVHKQNILKHEGFGFCILWYHTRDRGYDLIRALGSVSCVITHDTGDTICYRGGVLHLVLSHTRQWDDLLRALGAASCDVPHTWQAVRFVTGIGFCILCVIRRDTGGTICYGTWVLHLVLSPTRHEVKIYYGHWVPQLKTSHTRDRGYDLLRTLGAASCGITHETGGTVCYVHWVLHLAISQIRDRAYNLLQALGSASGVIIHETGGTIFYRHWFLYLVLPNRRQWVRFVTGIGWRIWWYPTQDRGEELLQALGSASCVITYETGGYDLLRALGAASCIIIQEIGGMIWYEPWILHLVLSYMRQEKRFITGIGYCILYCHTRDKRVPLVTGGGRVLHLVFSRMRQEVRFVIGIGFCVLCYQIGDTGHDLL